MKQNDQFGRTPNTQALIFHLITPPKMLPQVEVSPDHTRISSKYSGTPQRVYILKQKSLDIDNGSQ